MHEIECKKNHIGAKWEPVPVEYYPGGEPRINWKFGNVHAVRVRPKSLDTFVTAMFLVDALTDRGNDIWELHIPYVPGARQDRLNATGDFLFTLKSVSKMINERGFSEVHVWDPHSDVTTALIENAMVVPAREIIRHHLYDKFNTWDAVIAPDAGAAKRAGEVAQMLKVPLYHAWKSRDIETGNISGFGMEPPGPGHKHVLVVDDICDGGGTFLGLAPVLSDYGLTADLYVTHGIFSHGLTELLGSYREIFTTDSIIEKNFALNPDQSNRFHILKEPK